MLCVCKRNAKTMKKKKKKKKTKKEENKKRKTCYSGKRVHQVYIYYGLMGLKTHTLFVTSVSLCPKQTTSTYQGIWYWEEQRHHWKDNFQHFPIPVKNELLFLLLLLLLCWWTSGWIQGVGMFEGEIAMNVVHINAGHMHTGRNLHMVYTNLNLTHGLRILSITINSPQINTLGSCDVPPVIAKKPIWRRRLGFRV